MNDTHHDDEAPHDNRTIESMAAAKRRIALAIVLAVAAGSSWFYHISSTKGESRRLTDTAKRYIDKGQPDDARQMLIVARNLDPKNTSAKQLLDAIEAAAAEAAEEPVPPIPQPDSDTPAPSTSAPPDEEAVIVRIREAFDLVAKSDLLAAEKEFRSIAANDVAGRGHAALATFLIRYKPLSEVSEEVLELLKAIPPRPERYGLDAIELALSRAVIPTKDLYSWLEIIRTHPAANPTDLLKADSYEASARPRGKGIVVERTVRRLRKAPLEDRATAARWFASIGEHAAVAQIISREDALTNRDLFSLWLEVMERTLQFDVALDALSKSDIPMSPTVRRLFRTRVLYRSGLTDARGEYGSILADLEGLPGEYAEALAFICLAGDDAFTIKGLAKALADPAAAGIVFRKLIPAARARKDAVRLRQYYEMAAAAPALSGDINIKSELSYLNLLLDVPEDRDEIVQRCSRFPDAIAPRCTLAMALLLKNLAPQALVQLTSYKPNIYSVNLQPSQRLVLVTTLAANNRREEARKAAVGLRDMSLTQQETEFLAKWLKEPVPEAKSIIEMRLRKFGIPIAATIMALIAFWSSFRAWKTYKANLLSAHPDFPSATTSDLPSPTPPENLGIAPAEHPAPPLVLPANGFTLWLNPATWPVPKLKLPANGFTLWLNPATWPIPKLKLPANGFTLWLDPATWPVPKLKLPANGFTLWLDPATWPVPKLKLPANGFTLWLNPATWPVPKLKLPANGFTLWLDPATWPQPAPPAPTPAPAPPISIAASQGFSPLPPSSDSHTDPVARSTATAPASSQPAPQQPQEASRPTQSLPTVASLTLAAAATVIYSSADTARRNAEASIAKADLAAKEASTNAALAATSLAALERKLADKDAELTATQADTTIATAELNKLLAAAEASASRASTLAHEKASALANIEKAIASANQELSSRETALLSTVTDLTEEVSKLNRTTGEEIAATRAFIATLEQEKAALTKDFAATDAERDSLNAAVDKLRRQIQSAP